MNWSNWALAGGFTALIAAWIGLLVWLIFGRKQDWEAHADSAVALVDQDHYEWIARLRTVHTDDELAARRSQPKGN